MNNERNIERTLGRIEAQLALLLEEQKRERQELEAIKREQAFARKQREEQAKRLEAVEKNTADFNKWKERGVGALMLISIAAALIGGGLAASWHKILDVFR